MAEALTMIQTQRSSISPEVLHSHHSFLKEIKLFGSDSQGALGKYLPLYAVLFCSVLCDKDYAYTRNTTSSTSSSVRMITILGVCFIITVLDSQRVTIAES